MDTALLAFDVDGLHQGRLLRPFDALVWMEALETELARFLLDNGTTSSLFTTNGSGDVHDPAPHSTLFFPIAHDARRARLDHILVHAPRGFDAEACNALNKLRQIKGPIGSATVILIDLGPKAEFAEKVDYFHQSKVWQSITPVVPYRMAHDRTGPSFEQQVRNELALHGLPTCSSIEVGVERGRFIAIDKFEASSTQNEGINVARDLVRPAIADFNPIENASTLPVFGLKLEFEELVHGPLALGRWARYGMGQFLPG
jgi:CRISPR-associated protein Csb2